MENYSILVVEDDDFFREALGQILEKRGYKVTPAENGRVAKEILSSKTFDLVISDIQMPFFTGAELIEWLTQRNSTPCILMTGFSNILETLSAHELGAKSFLSKPFSHDELFKVVESLLGPSKETETVVPQNLDLQYCSVSIAEFVAKPNIDFDVFIRLSKTKYIKIGHAGSTLPVNKINEYRSKGVRHLHIRSGDFRKLLDFNFEVLQALEKSPKISQEKRFNFARYTGELILEKCFVDGVDKESFNEANQLVQQSINSIIETKEYYDLIEALNTSSNIVYAHSLGVSLYSVMIARRMGLESSSTFYKLSMGGLFHDVGKKEIPEEIWSKPRVQLQQKERTILESHPTRSKEILLELKSIPEDVVEIAYQHHEDCLGTGYPRGLSRAKIHPLAKIVYVANRFVEFVLSTEQRMGITADEAILQMSRDIERMDPKVFAALKSFVVSKPKSQPTAT